MNIAKINTTLATPHFYGNRNNNKKENIENSPKVPVLVNVAPDKLTNALKAAVLIPAASLPLILGSCDKTEGCDDYWAAGGDGTSITYPSIHVLPKIKVDSLTFANDTVRVSRDLSPTSKLNQTLNGVLNTLNIDRTHRGAFPAVIAFQTPEFIQYMKLDGLESNDNKYIYDVQKHFKDGGLDIYKSEFTTSDDDLIMKNLTLNNPSEYKFKAAVDTVTSYKNVNGTFVKDAVYGVNDERKFPVIKITTDGDTTKFSNITVFNVEHDR